MTCPKCETELSPDARFCHKCGARIVQDETTGWRAGLPWAIAGLSVGALLTIVIGRLAGNDGGVPAPAAGGPGGVVRAPDISQMSPEEQANRLFDRVMRHAEAGQMDSVLFFLPMALQTHNMLPALSTDARFHIGLLHLVGGNAAAALAQGDTILRATPNHLFGLMLRARALEARGDSAAARRAYSAFVSSEAAERARQRPEYADHATTLDLFRDEARTKTGR
ncbi:MAG: zinc-ribbon domain-containing protein [Gemmatimonadales bacterium]